MAHDPTLSPLGNAFVEGGGLMMKMRDQRDMAKEMLAEAHVKASVLRSDIKRLTAERDSARNVAVRLEQENAQLRAALTATVKRFSDVSIELRLAAIAMHQILAAGQA